MSCTAAWVRQAGLRRRSTLETSSRSVPRWRGEERSLRTAGRCRPVYLCVHSRHSFKDGLRGHAVVDNLEAQFRWATKRAIDSALPLQQFILG